MTEVTVDAETTEVKSGLETLRELPWEDRIIYMLSQLERLKNGSEAKAFGPILTKKQEQEQFFHKGKMMAYRDVSSFFTTIFEKELRDRLMPKEEPK